MIIILSAIVLIGIIAAVILIVFNGNEKEEDPYQLKLDEFKQLILDPENADGLYDGMKAVRDAALAARLVKYNVTRLVLGTVFSATSK